MICFSLMPYGVREFFYGHAFGVRVQRGQPCGWDRDQGRGAWWRSGWWLNLVAGKTIQPPCGRRENKPTALVARGNAPLLPSAAASSPEGQILAALCFELLTSSETERRVDFHLKVKRLTIICASLALLQIMFAVHGEAAAAP